MLEKNEFNPKMQKLKQMQSLPLEQKKLSIQGHELKSF
jgi:hypothetical protein